MEVRTQLLAMLKVAAIRPPEALNTGPRPLLSMLAPRLSAPSWNIRWRNQMSTAVDPQKTANKIITLACLRIIESILLLQGNKS